MRVLIYGAGVIGSLYAALLSETGTEVTVYARGKRLQDLQSKGLLYKRNGRIETAKVIFRHFPEQAGVWKKKCSTRLSPRGSSSPLRLENGRTRTMSQRTRSAPERMLSS